MLLYNNYKMSILKPLITSTNKSFTEENLTILSSYIGLPATCSQTFSTNLNNGNYDSYLSDLSTYIDVSPNSELPIYTNDCAYSTIEILNSVKAIRNIYETVFVNYVDKNGYFIELKNSFTIELINLNSYVNKRILQNDYKYNYIKGLNIDINMSLFDNLNTFQKSCFLNIPTSSSNIFFQPDPITNKGLQVFYPSELIIDNITTELTKIYFNYGLYCIKGILYRILNIDLIQNLNSSINLQLDTNKDLYINLIKMFIDSQFKIDTSTNKIYLPININASSYPKSIDFVFLIFTDILYKSLIYNYIEIIKNLIIQYKNVIYVSIPPTYTLNSTIVYPSQNQTYTIIPGTTSEDISEIPPIDDGVIDTNTEETTGETTGETNTGETTRETTYNNNIILIIILSIIIVGGIISGFLFYS